MIDNLPGAIRMVDENNPSDVRYDRGFTLGSSFPAADGKGTVHYINNHIRFVLLVNEERPTRGFRVVGFEVEPFRCGGPPGCALRPQRPHRWRSVKHKYQGEWDDEHTQLLTCNDKRHVDMSTEKQVRARASAAPAVRSPALSRTQCTRARNAPSDGGLGW